MAGKDALDGGKTEIRASVSGGARAPGVAKGGSAPTPEDARSIGELGEGLALVRKERPEVFARFRKARINTLDGRQELIYDLPNAAGTSATEGESPAMLASATPASAKPARFVSYLRVSTRKQEASGLGVEAQRAAVGDFIARMGGAALREFVETESGEENDRRELAAALAFAKRSKATLLVAKLDRLSRNVAFLSALMESGVDFIACDNPHANRLTLHILASMAEHEREMIARRTREALAAAKARGVALGSARPGHWEGREDARREGSKKGGERAAAVHRESAANAYGDVLPIMRDLRAGGASYQRIADHLNGEGIPSRRGKQWTSMQVRNVLLRDAAGG